MAPSSSLDDREWRWHLIQLDVRQPRPGKPHIMKRRGVWLFVDTPRPTMQQPDFYTAGDPRPTGVGESPTA